MMLLHRAFHGLNAFFYQEAFSKNIADPYLSKVALSSLTKAGQDQQNLYDLSFSQNNIKNNGPVEGDLGVMFLLSDERPNAGFKEWLTLFTHANADLVLVSVTDKALSKSQMNTIKKLSPRTVFLSIGMTKQDPLGLSQIIGLKMLLNAHSTAVMTKLGRVVGNTMTYVQPGNLKLIGRATHLIQLHVNATLKNKA